MSVPRVHVRAVGGQGRYGMSTIALLLQVGRRGPTAGSPCQGRHWRHHIASVTCLIICYGAHAVSSVADADIDMTAQSAHAKRPEPHSHINSSPRWESPWLSQFGSWTPLFLASDADLAACPLRSLRCAHRFKAFRASLCHIEAGIIRRGI